jgi:N-methylhydantoinase B
MLKSGDAFRLRSGGGGGYGSPLERPVDDVAADARQGYISIAAAEGLYGVVLDAESFEVDGTATEKLRAAMRRTAA